MRSMCVGVAETGELTHMRSMCVGVAETGGLTHMRSMCVGVAETEYTKSNFFLYRTFV